MSITGEENRKINYTNKETILELFELYSDELYERIDEDKEIVKEILMIEEPFYESLNDIQKKQFEEIMELNALDGDEIDRKIFIFAFCLAVRLILESKN